MRILQELLKALSLISPTLSTTRPNTRFTSVPRLASLRASFFKLAWTHTHTSPYRIQHIRFGNNRVSVSLSRGVMENVRTVRQMAIGLLQRVLSEQSVSMMEKTMRGVLYCTLWYGSILAGFLFVACPMLPLLLVSPPIFRKCGELLFSCWEMYPTVSVLYLSCMSQ